MALSRAVATAMTKDKMAARIAELEDANRDLENEIDGMDFSQEIVITGEMMEQLRQGRTLEISGRYDSVTLIPREDDGVVFKIKLTFNDLT